MSTLSGGYAKIETDADKIYLYDVVPSRLNTSLEKQKEHLIIDDVQYDYYFYVGDENDLDGYTKKLIKKSENKYIEEVDEIKIEGHLDTPMETGDIDSTNITFVSKKIVPVDTGTLDIPTTITYNGDVYSQHDTPIGIGSFGVVFKYLNKEGKGFALKAIRVEGDNFEHDLEIIKFLRKHPDSSVCSDYYIKSVKVGEYIIMPLVEGDITELKDSLINQHIYIIIKTIIAELYCLFKLGLVHLDIKLANVFYYVNKGTLKILLGDVGGIQTIGTLKRTKKLVPLPTYCPIEFLLDSFRNDSYGYYPYTDENNMLIDIENIGKILSWQVGSLIVEFFNGYQMANTLILNRELGSPKKRINTLHEIIIETNKIVEKSNDEFSNKLIKILTDCLKLHADRPTIKQLYYDY